MSEESALKAFVDSSFLSEADKERAMAAYKTGGKAAVLAIFDATAAPLLKERLAQYHRDLERLEATITTLDAARKEEEDALEAELLEALSALPGGPSAERDAVWNDYYDKCDAAREAHAKRARTTIGAIVGLPGL